MSPWHPFSRSYGVILPSSLTILLPPALGFSPHPPVSVYGTGTVRTIAAFLGACPSLSPTSVRSSFGAAFRIRFFLDAGLSNLPRVPFRVVPHIRVPTVLSYRSTGISTCRPSTTALALALGPDLPRADQLDSGNLGYSACHLATHSGILSSCASTAPSGTASSAQQCSSTDHCFGSDPRASAACLAPCIFGAGPLD